MDAGGADSLERGSLEQVSQAGSESHLDCQRRDLNSSVAPVLLYISVSPCFAGFSFYLDLPFLPSKSAVPLCMRAFPSALVTMVLLCKNSSSCSSWNYLHLGFAVQLWDAGLCPSLVQPFPVCVMGQLWRQHCLQGTAVSWSHGTSSRFLGTRIPLLRARLSHRCISCYS